MTEIGILLTNMESALSEFQGFQGWVIGKCSVWIRKTREEREKLSHAILLKRNDMLAVFQVYGNNRQFDGMLQVTLIKPYLKKSVEERRKDKRGKTLGNLVFSAEQINRFLDSVSDNNPVHRGDGAIVPGFMIMNDIMVRTGEEVMKKIGKNFVMEARFLVPMKVGEEAELWKEDIESGGFRICGVIKESEIFDIKIYKKN